MVVDYSHDMRYTDKGDGMAMYQLTCMEENEKSCFFFHKSQVFEQSHPTDTGK